MAGQGFRGEAGRPFGTVAAFLCLFFTCAVIVLGRIEAQMLGTITPLDPDPALLHRLQEVWGLFLASEIVKVVTGGLFVLAMWTLARPIGPPTTRNRLARWIGTIGALLFIVASRQGIVAAAHLSDMEVIPYGRWFVAVGSVGIALIGIWAALLAAEARRAQSLPRWVRDTGMALCVAALVGALFPTLLLGTALISLVWWAGLFATLYKPEDRVSR